MEQIQGRDPAAEHKPAAKTKSHEQRRAAVAENESKHSQNGAAWPCALTRNDPTNKKMAMGGALAGIENQSCSCC
jgi:hypothetical protein